LKLILNVMNIWHEFGCDSLTFSRNASTRLIDRSE